MEAPSGAVGWLADTSEIWAILAHIIDVVRQGFESSILGNKKRLGAVRIRGERAQVSNTVSSTAERVTDGDRRDGSRRKQIEMPIQRQTEINQKS